MGRPKKKIDAKDVEKAAAEGLAEYQIAEALGVSADTFRTRKREDPAIAEALARGRAAARGKVENAAFQCAMKAVEKPQYQTSLIFWLKARAGWKEKSHLEISGDAGAPLAVTVYLPANGRDGEALSGEDRSDGGGA